jgi:hypothetical protein
MQVGKTVVAAILVSVTLSAGAFAVPRQEDGLQRARPRQVRKAQKPANLWINTIGTILDWLSIPPG